MGGDYLDRMINILHLSRMMPLTHTGLKWGMPTRMRSLFISYWNIFIKEYKDDPFGNEKAVMKTDILQIDCIKTHIHTWT